METLFRLENYSYAYPGRAFVLKEVSLSVGPGECHCLTGPTGSGKTTLLLAIRGLLPPGEQKGAIYFPSSARAGIVMQNPETQILAGSVGAEVAFALENHCVPPELMPEKVAGALSDVGLNLPPERDTEALSMGQKYRLILASLLVMAPDLLLLDEPVAQLDRAGLEKLVRVIQRLKAKGVSFLVCEHHPGPLRAVIDAFWRIEKGGTVCQSDALPPQRTRSRPVKPPLPDALETVVEVQQLEMADEDDSPVWSDVSFSVTRGQRVAVYGPNGAGKTTLLRSLAGFVRPASGTIRILGEPPVPSRLRGRVGCLFQNPRKQLFENTVFDEVAFPLKRMNGNRKKIASHVAAMLSRCGISDLAKASPHKLSYGQKHLVALASLLVFRPELLLLDDPFAGLDPERTEQVTEILSDLSETEGTTIIWTSHDPDALSDWAHSALRVEGGRIVTATV